MPKYDRELIARMLETPAVFEDASRREQARLLRESDNWEVDARTVVREVPEGMVLVPREPTDAMIDAAWECDAATDWVGEHKRIHSAADCYRAMLAAASGEKGVG